MGTSHRQAPVTSLVGRVREDLMALFNAPAGYEVVLGNGGSTAFWDIATLCLIERRSQHVVTGEFGGKFAAATGAAPFLAEPDVIVAEPGRGAAPVASDVDAYALTHNETSTGILTVPVRPDDEALVLVDATSAAGGVAVDIAATDAYYFAPQKVFGADGGLWLALLSPAALERATRVEHERWVPQFLSLTTAAANSRANQTLNTPALATLIMLAEQIEYFLDQGGLAWAAGRSAASAAHLYGWAEAREWASPFVQDAAARSPVVGTIDLAEGLDSATIRAELRANGIVDIDPYRKLGRNQLRIGMFPAIDPADIEALTACIDYVVERLGG